MKGTITRKLGPLPVWAWAAIIGGTFLAVRLLRGGTAKQDASGVQLIPTGAPEVDPSQGFLEDMSFRLDRFETDLGRIISGAAPTPPAVAPPATAAPKKPGLAWPKGLDLGTVIQGLRKQYPNWYKAWLATGGKVVQKPGETRADRDARLRREMTFYTGKMAAPAISAKP